MSYCSDRGKIETERKWRLVIRCCTGRVLTYVTDRTKYNDLRECGGVLLRNSVREFAAAKSSYSVHVRDVRCVGGVPRALTPVFLK